MDQFGLYSQYYDLLYQDKNYAGEANYVAQLVRQFAPDTQSILEFGCGTGIHAELIARMGFDVCGIERSEEMLKQAVLRSEKLSLEKSARGGFEAHGGDAQSFHSEKLFGAVISLFHVVSYQTEWSAVQYFFANAARHLTPGGIFLFDVWYGPAVLTEKPAVRVKRMQNEHLSVVRTAEPTLLPNENMVRVEYQIFSKQPGGEVFQSLQETHQMRYFFKPEIVLLAEVNAMKLEHCEEWMSRRPLSDTTWGACFVLRKQ